MSELIIRILAGLRKNFVALFLNIILQSVNITKLSSTEESNLSNSKYLSSIVRFTKSVDLLEI